jgi:hypothetical protein
MMLFLHGKDISTNFPKNYKYTVNFTPNIDIIVKKTKTYEFFTNFPCSKRKLDIVDLAKIGYIDEDEKKYLIMFKHGLKRDIGFFPYKITKDSNARYK